MLHGCSVSRSRARLLPRAYDRLVIGEELEELTGGRPAGWSVEPLTHNPANEVTASIDRVRADGLSAVVKVLAPTASSGSHWSASDFPSHWNYWRREALVYEHDLPSAFADSGLGAPRLLGGFERPGGAIALWLEDVDGLPGSEWPLERYGTFARSLGLAQGRAAR